MGYKMNNGSKNYTIKSYRDGGLVETNSSFNGPEVKLSGSLLTLSTMSIRACASPFP